jgi:hypothetical protein
MALVLYDTNILIDNFAGIREAIVELTRYDDAIISSITWIEVACKMDHAGKRNFKSFLTDAGIRVCTPTTTSWSAQPRYVVIASRTRQNSNCLTALFALLPNRGAESWSHAIQPTLAAKAPPSTCRTRS